MIRCRYKTRKTNAIKNQNNYNHERNKSIRMYFCNKYYKKTKKTVEKHEVICFSNPKNRACQSCLHNHRVSHTVYNPFYGGNPGSTDYDTQINWCNKLDIQLEKDTLRRNCLYWEPKIDFEELIEEQNKQQL